MKRRWRGMATCVVVAWLAAAPFSEVRAEEEVDVGRLIQSTRALRAKFQRDPYRPEYHFVTPEGLCGPFDPNGALYWKGRYHLMYIFQNEKGHCWGHVSSSGHRAITRVGKSN